MDAAFERIARATGKGSADARRRLLRGLLARLGDDEQRFLCGLVMGELRQGALEGLVIEAVAAPPASRRMTCAAPSCWPATCRTWPARR